jgi:hypothetical protein
MVVMRGKSGAPVKRASSWIGPALARVPGKRYMGVLSAAIIVIAVFGIAQLLPVELTGEAVEAERSCLEEPIGPIEQNIGEVLVYENETKEMYVDTRTTNIRIVDKRTGAVWETLATGAAVVGSDGSISESYGKFVSPFEIDYVNDNGVRASMNAYNFSIRDMQFAIDRLKNGVQITYELQDKAIRVFEHLPRRISFSRYEEAISSRVDKALEEGLISQTEYNNFNMFWDAFYSRNMADQCYVYSVGSLPPTSSIRLMIKILDLVGYDAEQLIYDNQQFGETTSFTLRTVFTVTIETMLEGDDLVVKVPTAYTKSNNDFDHIQSISVYPYFGNVHVGAVQKEEPGFIFVPDGSGALIQLNAYNQNQAIYSKPVHSNDSYDEYYYLTDYQQGIDMPVFGMCVNQGDHWKGFLAIIENGAELAHIRASSADRSSRGSANQVNAAFDILQTSNVKLFGHYATDETSHFAKSVSYDYNAVVRYKLLAADTLEYYDLVKVYRDYLIDRYDLTVGFGDYQPKVFIDLIGTVNTKKHFLGIPYQSHFSMTAYREAIELLKELAEVKKVVNYRGAVNWGINQSLLSRIDLAEENGSAAELEELREYVRGQHDEFFVHINLLQIYTNKNGFRPKMGIYALDSKPLRLTQFNLANNRFERNTSYYQILSPAYLPSLVERFIAANDVFDSISVEDLGGTYLVDYRKQRVVTPPQAQVIEEESLERLSEYRLMLNDPFIKNVRHADYIRNVRRTSSDFIMFYTCIPFKQLVLNGIVEHSTEDVNLNTDRPPRYYVLQALELGSHPKFTLSYKDSSLLKDTEFKYLHSTGYDIWKDEICSMYSEISEAYREIGTNEIAHHTMPAPNVFQTTYKNGVRVLVNYNYWDVEVDGHELEALGYRIMLGGAQ